MNKSNSISCMKTPTKFCTKCKTEKSIHDFGISKQTKSGYRHRCTLCRNARRREIYKKPELRTWNKVWTFEKCQYEALWYTNRSDFAKYSCSAYGRAATEGFLDKICGHMTSPRVPYRFWDFDQCQEEALKYKTKVHFKTKNSSAYSICQRNGWIPLVCNHMEAVGNQYKRLVYAYEFPNNVVYVGLTCNQERRHLQHAQVKTSPVYKYSRKSKLKPVYKSISKKYVTAEKAQQLEYKTINKYKNNGWRILNRAKAGALGWSKIHWTFEKCRKEALKYNTRSEFQNNSPGACAAARKNNWMQICDHMVYRKLPKGTWTYESCKRAALQSKSRTEFKSEYPGAAGKAIDEGFYKEIVSHLKKLTNTTKVRKKPQYDRT